MPTLPAAIDVVNGTIVPLYFPTVFRPDELDKLGWTAVITLAAPNVFAGFALIFGTRDWKRYSYTLLSIGWFWSIALVALGVYTHYGVFNHLIQFFVIAHIEWEWLIITYLLGFSFQQGYISAAFVAALLYFTDLAFGGIRGTFFVASAVGGWGDVFIPFLLWNGGQKVLALGGVGHFLNALVTFVAFTDYVPVSAYLGLELLAGTMHTLFTVAGIYRLQRPAIQLPPDSEASSPDFRDSRDLSDHSSGTRVNIGPVKGLGKGSSGGVIPVPERKEVVKLALIAAVLSLGASIPLNFAPKWPL